MLSDLPRNAFLCGCVGCNNWQAMDSGERRHLPDDDIAALMAMVTRWT